MIEAVRYARRVAPELRSTSQRFVLLALASYAGPDGRAWPSVPTLAAVTGYNPSYVRRVLAQLVKLGVIEVTERPGRSSMRRFPIDPPAPSNVVELSPTPRPRGAGSLSTPRASEARGSYPHPAPQRRGDPAPLEARQKYQGRKRIEARPVIDHPQDCKCEGHGWVQVAERWSAPCDGGGSDDAASAL